MAIYESGEDYLEQILAIGEEKGTVRAIDIATALNYTKASVSIAMKNLREKGMITVDDENHLHLTAEGEKLARRVYDRHRRLTAFLVSLGVPEDIAR